VLCALRFPDAQICASDLSEPALALAAENIGLHGLSTRIELLQGDLLAPHTGEPFDLIVCNPPYVCDASMALLPGEFQAEPRIALAGGPDGMQLVARILSEAAQHLTENGLLVLEIGHEAAHFERAFPRLEFACLPVEAGEQMVVAIDAQALRSSGSPGRSTRRARAVTAARQPGRRSTA
jgi:ribosomal protein L3 glutamine methyltransferase